MMRSVSHSPGHRCDRMIARALRNEGIGVFLRSEKPRWREGIRVVPIPRIPVRAVDIKDDTAAGADRFPLPGDILACDGGRCREERVGPAHFLNEGSGPSFLILKRRN